MNGLSISLVTLNIELEERSLRSLEIKSSVSSASGTVIIRIPLSYLHNFYLYIIKFKLLILKTVNFNVNYSLATNLMLVRKQPVCN